MNLYLYYKKGAEVALMKKRWGKGEPVNLSDLLKITPVANEILHLSGELDMSSADIIWIVAQIINNDDGDVNLKQCAKLLEDSDFTVDEWDEEIDFENLEEEMEQAPYTVNVKINSGGKFPEIGFKAGINDKEDINYFFEMVLEMLDKIE
jgi:hypothetical protein